MELSKPLSYQSLKCVVEQMDANKRIFLVSYLPSLRNVHKAVPLKIGTLQLNKSSFIVDHIKYSFTSVVRKDPIEKKNTLSCEKWIDVIDGVPYDVNKFGNEDRDQTLSHGDILIGEKRPVYIDRARRLQEIQEEDQRLQEEHGNILETYRLSLIVVQEALAEREKILAETQKILKEWKNCIDSLEREQDELLDVKQEKNIEDTRQIRETFEQIMNRNRQDKEKYREDLAEYRQDKKENQQEIKKNQIEIEKNERAIEEHRRSMMQPNVHIQYTIYNTSSNNLQKSIGFPFGTKIRDALRQQVKNLLSGKRVLKVKRLIIGISSGILRMPGDMKLSIKELCVRANASLAIEAVEPILDASSYPLQKLSIEVENQQDLVFRNHILRSSKCLNMEIAERSNDSWSDVLLDLPQTTIHLSGKNISPEDIINLVRNWKQHFRSIGTMLSMKCDPISGNMIMKKLRQSIEEMEAVERLVQKEYKFLHGLSIPMNETSNLNIYRCKAPNHYEEMSKKNGQPWIIVLEIMGVRPAWQRDE